MASTTVKKKTGTTASKMTVEDLVGLNEVKVERKVSFSPRKSVAPRENSPSSVGRSGAVRRYTPQGFDGLVDNRRIPDADVPTEVLEGVLDLEPNGHGILRPKFIPSDKDIYISTSQIRRFGLRPGDLVYGPARQPKENERYWGLLKVEKVNGKEIDKLGQRPNYDDMTPLYPDEQIRLETETDLLSTRLIDLVAPIGKGQRGLIVSPPKAGKTTMLKQIADGVAKNHKNIHLMAVLVGERPEEVTDIKRSVKGDVVASNFDEPGDKQTRAAEIALERAKRLVEMGQDVLILLDSITRLARAYNLSIPTSGRTLSGGFDPAALHPPKKFFGAARNFEEGGSLTIIGTALVDTGSRMDELIYEEFKGTGNMELHLDRALEQRRVFPAIDVQLSGTRQEQLLFDKKTYEKIATMRRMLDVLGKNERTELLLERLKKTKTNKEFLESLNKG
ncbi:transcription termination factor Rho [Candidatus Beckwithbacteria bacterium CG10_big_fil_rev_8_21_14_0_10_34_10]|uniref:Transcription termination factor Rho n=1 Tax=Candidatus Beckwithbacteria bacterium CG10_big_fil_rev_8_21_14_0_10_34_10 TaxID=1974495 RepID=A0A2H0W8C9_9BACT|nr:MAG: transcription termination factor Rho [Candidatus Beckwithbacteria bacterium CG10_big_fil_rev_8_21_14_0_10_34_10]